MTSVRSSPGLVAHCDWSLDPKKRWMAVATKGSTGWIIGMPEPVGLTASLFRRLADRASNGIFVGFDFPIGLPKAYGALTGKSDFRAFLAALGQGEWSDWFRVCERADEISIHRPFYPQRPGGTQRVHLHAGLGLTEGDGLLRTCDRRTSERPDACSIFWTLGGNQVGKAAISGWSELLRGPGRPALWPFDGQLNDLLRDHPIVVAETYPGDAYSQLGIPRTPIWSKRKQDGRASVAPYLLRCIEQRGHDMSLDLHQTIQQGFFDTATAEDQFDALVGLLAMIEVVDGYRPDGCPDDPDVHRWEGWILGHQRGAAVKTGTKSRKELRPRSRKKPAIGSINDHRQKVIVHADLRGNDPDQKAYILVCLDCSALYGTGSEEVSERCCPACGGGLPGVNFT